MRKLLLATAAILGATAGLTGLASAQTETLQGTVATPASGGSYTYGDNNYMGGTMTKGPVANPTPGTMVIRLGVRMDVAVGASWSNLDSYSAGTPGTGGCGVLFQRRRRSARKNWRTAGWMMLGEPWPPLR